MSFYPLYTYIIIIHTDTKNYHFTPTAHVCGGGKKWGIQGIPKLKTILFPRSDHMHSHYTKCPKLLTPHSRGAKLRECPVVLYSTNRAVDAWITIIALLSLCVNTKINSYTLSEDNLIHLASGLGEIRISHRCNKPCMHGILLQWNLCKQPHDLTVGLVPKLTCAPLTSINMQATSACFSLG